MDIARPDLKRTRRNRWITYILSLIHIFTRDVLLEIASSAGYPPEERVLYPADLFGADEVFLSSTNRNLLAVSEIAGHPIATGSAIRKLEGIFENYVEEYVTSRVRARHPRE